MQLEQKWAKITAEVMLYHIIYIHIHSLLSVIFVCI